MSDVEVFQDNRNSLVTFVKDFYVKATSEELQAVEELKVLFPYRGSMQNASNIKTVRLLRKARRLVGTEDYKSYVVKFKEKLVGLDYDEYLMDRIGFPIMYLLDREALKINAISGFGLIAGVAGLMVSITLGVVTAGVTGTGAFGGFLVSGVLESGFLISGVFILKGYIRDLMIDYEPHFQRDSIVPRGYFRPNELIPYEELVHWSKDSGLRYDDVTYLELQDAFNISPMHESVMPNKSLMSNESISGNEKEIIGIGNDIAQEQLSALDAVSSQLNEWEVDILKVVQYPALFDMGVSETRELHEAMALAVRSKPEVGERVTSEHPFTLAVVRVELAWRAAVDNAKRMETSSFSSGEQERLSTALRLLNISLDEAGSPEERQVSYKRAMKELKGLIIVPEKSIAEIEKNGLRLEISN